MPSYQTLVEKVLLPLNLWRRGDARVLKWKEEFDRTQFLPKQELDELVLLRLRRVIEHAYQHTPYYRRRMDEVGVNPGDIQKLEDLSAFPVLEKRDIQSHVQEMISEKFRSNDLIKNQTGGSTGTPISFYLSPERKWSRTAATLRHDEWAGKRYGDKIAFVWGAPRDIPTDSFKQRLKNLLMSRTLFLDTAEFTEKKLHDMDSQLKRFRPKVIQAYARSLTLVARYMKSQGIQPYSPESIITSAEALDADDRKLLEETFGCPVFNRYGCREVSVIASECDAHTGMHVMAEGIHVEILNPSALALGEPQTGEVLVTDLLNHAMPLIRYRIGDMANWSEGSCPCGRALPRLAQVQGRVTEFIVGMGDKLVSGVYLATYVVAYRPSLGQVQIIQDRPGSVRYRIKPGEGFHLASDREYLTQESRKFLGENIDVEIELVEELERLPSGKFLFSRSSVVPEFLAGKR